MKVLVSSSLLKELRVFLTGLPSHELFIVSHEGETHEELKHKMSTIGISGTTFVPPSIGPVAWTANLARSLNVSLLLHTSDMVCAQARVLGVPSAVYKL